MKKLLSLLFLCSLLCAQSDIELSVSGAKSAVMNIAIIVLNKTNDELCSIADTIKKDLQFTDQFASSVQKYESNLNKKDLAKIIKSLAQTGTPLALCIDSHNNSHVEWRLYDTFQGTMLGGKKYKKKGGINRGWAHAIADGAYKTLTGNDGLFSSRIAYCKNFKDSQGKTIKKIYTADFDGSNEELLVDSQSTLIAPRWHSKKPSLCYSEYTDTKVRLMSTSMNKKKKDISQFSEGIEMLPHFAPNGTDYVYCASRGNGNCQIYLRKNDAIKRCTKNTGNNSSPIFLDENRLCFCSNFQTGRPQIYIGNLETGHLQRITTGGYCTSPSYCPKTNKIAYHKMINGIMQIIVYDCASKRHTQVTHNGGSKHEACWSPDGTYLLYSHELSQTQSRLTTMNLTTKKTKYVGNTQDYNCYPHWSPCYNIFPVVT